MAPPRDTRTVSDVAAQAPPPGTGGGFAYTPPPSKAGPPSVEKRAAALFKRFPAWKRYWAVVKNAADRWKTDPIELIALLIFENGRANPGARSSAGAVGLAQILDNAVRRGLNPVQYDTFIAEWAGGDPRITTRMKQDPAFAIQYAAWRMAGSRGKYGSLDEWYRSSGYNPGFKGDSRGPGPSIYVGAYQPSIPQTPEQAAGASYERSQAREGLTANWAVITPKGIKFVQSVEPPRNTIRQYGVPVGEDLWIRAKEYYNNIYEAYVGTRAPDAAIAHILNSGLSDGALMSALSKSPSFRNGSLYKAHAGGIVEKGRSMLGGHWKADPELVRKAIVEQWDEATLTFKLRERPEYLKGPEFKKTQAGLLSQHQSIMGNPDQQGMVGIKEAALGGWSADQYAAYLRGSDAYKYSPEFQTKALAFADAMGLFTGQMATLKPGTAKPNTGPNVAGALPNSPRIPGQGSVKPPQKKLVVGGGYGG